MVASEGKERGISLGVAPPMRGNRFAYFFRLSF